MPEQVYTPKKYVDSVSAFEAGMESGITPLLLKKNQVGVAINCSLRGGFIHPRPPLIQRTLNFGGNDVLATLVASGLFQGGGYYRPDTGTESLLASISGHLIQFQETSFGGIWNVSDVSVPNDFNSSTNPQCWMWQSEKWMIVNDGSGVLPIFFDGNTSRRSLGPSKVVGTGIAFNPGSPPPIGSNVVVTLNAQYTGAYGIPVIFNGAFYELTQNALGYPVTLTNVNDTSTTEAQNSQVIVQTTNNVYGTLSQAVTATLLSETFQQHVGSNGAWVCTWQIVCTFTGQTNFQVGSNYTTPDGASWTFMGNGVFQTTTIFYAPNSGPSPPPEPPPDSIVFTTPPVAYVNYPTGSVFTGSGQTVSTVIGTLNQAFTVPPTNSTVIGYLSAIYTGASGQTVFINGFQYTIAVVSTGPSSIINLLNSSDTGTSPYTNPSTIDTVPELPAGRMGCYGMGRNWFSLTNGINYEAGDIVGGGSGTAAYNFRDAVLRTTENDFLTNGGTFSLPGTGDIITAMVFPPVLDTSLGVGSLQIFTPFSVYANNAPADRTTWANLTWPIQTESLKDQGALAQNSTVVVNSDVFFRSDFNLCSLVLARRQFQLNQWGNKPIADEMQRILELDNQSLLPFGSAVSFDNRYLSACVGNTSQQGVFNSGVIALNFDPLSSLRTNDPPAWEGAWSGINVMQLVTGRVNGMRRCFAFSYNVTKAQIELYELLGEAPALQAKVYNDQTAAGSVPIGWFFETPILFNEDKHPLTELIQLRDGEIQISNIVGTVTLKIFYKPDYYPCWTLWRQLTVCADMSGTNANATYHMRLPLGEPDGTVNNLNRPMRIGRFFQFRFEITGYCQFDNLQVSAITTPEPVFSPVNANTSTCQAIDCAVPADLTLYSLQGLPPQPLTPITPPTFNFFNEAVFYVVSCPGQVLTFTGSLPTWITLDQNNNQLAGAAGTFGGTTQLTANASAQAALNAFGAQQVALGNLACGSLVCPATGNNFAITGYADGLIPVNEGTSGSGYPVWNGSFGFYNQNDCYWSGWDTSQGAHFYSINGFACYCAIAYLVSGTTWALKVYGSYQSGTLEWSGTKSGGSDPSGTYTNDNTGTLATPATLTVAQISGMATTVHNQSNCGSG